MDIDDDDLTTLSFFFLALLLFFFPFSSLSLGSSSTKIRRSGGSTPRRSRRGDIHSSLPMSSPSLARRTVPTTTTTTAAIQGNAGASTTGAIINGRLPTIRSSSPFGADLLLHSDDTIRPPPPSFSHAASGEIIEEGGGGGDGNEDGMDGNGLVKLIWGTTISLQESMNLFREFLKGFKPKYRGRYNDEMAKQSQEEDGGSGIVPPPNPLYDGLTNVKANETLYLTYLRTMRITQQSNLNLDALNLLSFPPTKKLYHQLVAYPQEVIPIMDQVLKDVMIELAEEDWESMEDGLERDLVEEEGREMSGRVYKVRPFGGERSVNMRELNPQGGLER